VDQYLNYFGCNQYITQRALGADLKTARAGLLFAAFLKLLIPLIAVLPGIAAFCIVSTGHVPASNGRCGRSSKTRTIMLIPLY